MYMTTASCLRVCRIFRNFVSTAEFLSYWSRQAEYDYEARSLSHCCRVKALSITYSEFASVALVVQHAYRIFSLSHCIVVCGLSWCTIFLYIISLTARISEKIFWKWIVFSFSLKILYETLFILRRIQRDVVTNVETSSRKILAALLTVQSDLNFVDRFSKNPLVKKLMKIRILGAELFHTDRQMDEYTDRQTDLTKLTVAFHCF